MLNAASDIEADTIFSPFDLTRRAAVIAAVSGGSDSLAMLLILREWLERRVPLARLIAVTVDHRLRAGSDDEARRMAGFCAARGIAHRTLAWTGGKPVAGLAAAAREARYRLLEQAAHDAGSDIVVTGHTADDQAETVLMRSRRGGGHGLAGMAPATLLNGNTWLLRPLLGVGRARLRGYLDDRNVAWVDDPTNADHRYERARVRQELAGRSDGERARLLEIAGAAAARRGRVTALSARLVADFVRQIEPGVLRADPAFGRVADGEAACHALRALLSVAGGTGFLPDAARTERLLHRLSQPSFRGTLSRALVVVRRDGIWLARETRGLPAPRVLRSGDVWDGRFRVSAAAGAACIAPQRAIEGVDHGTDDASPAAVRRAAAAARPGKCAPDGLAEAASPLGADEAIPVLGPYHHLLPSFDLPLARALAKLVGATEIPAPPFAGHNGAEG